MAVNTNERWLMLHLTTHALTRPYHAHRMEIEDHLIFIQTSETKSVLLKFLFLVNK